MIKLSTPIPTRMRCVCRGPYWGSSSDTHQGWCNSVYSIDISLERMNIIRDDLNDKIT